MPALKQLLSLVKHIVKTATNRADKSKILSDIHKTADITKLLMGSLISCHQSAVTASINMGIALYPHLAIDGKYTHLEVCSALIRRMMKFERGVEEHATVKLLGLSRENCLSTNIRYDFGLRKCLACLRSCLNICVLRT